MNIEFIEQIMSNLFLLDYKIVNNEISLEELKVLLFIISQEVLNKDTPNIIILDYIKNIINHLTNIENNKVTDIDEGSLKTQTISQEEFILNELIHDRTPGLKEE